MARAVEMGFDTNEDEVFHAVAIDPHNIQREYVEFPGELARWNFRLIRAREAVQMAELAQERGEAALRIRIKNELVKSGQKATVDDLEAMIVARPEYLELAKAVMEAERIKRQLEAARESFQAKKEMLVSLGADLRAEREQPPQVNDERRRRFRG